MSLQIGSIFEIEPISELMTGQGNNDNFGDQAVWGH